jgi:hypothetical protein
MLLTRDPMTQSSAVRRGGDSEFGPAALDRSSVTPNILATLATGWGGMPRLAELVSRRMSVCETRRPGLVQLHDLDGNALC